MRGQSLCDQRKKMCCGVDGDHLSSLPDNILSYIMSLLPLKEVVRTSVFSKKWEFVWTCADTLDFDDRENCSSNRKKEAFVDFVGRALLLCRMVRTFRLSCCNGYEPSRVNMWINLALSRNVQKLDVRLRYPQEEIELPRGLIDSNSLTELKLDGRAALKLSLGNTFSNLTILDLECITLVSDDSSSSKLLFSFPVLKVFRLNSCKWWNVRLFKIDAPALATFEMTNSQYECSCGTFGDCSVEIDGSSLVKFIFGGLVLEDYILSRPSSVVDVTLHLGISDHSIKVKCLPLRGQIGSRAVMLLTKFSNLTCLGISGDITETFLHAAPPTPFPVLGKLISLVVYSSQWCGALFRLLEGAPKLESLELSVGHQCLGDCNRYMERLVPECVSQSLKVVNLTNFHGEAQEALLVKFLLKNSFLLEKLTISLREWQSQLKVHLENQLTSIPKASTDVQVLLVVGG